GNPTSEVDTIRQAMRPLKALYGPTQAAEFGPLALAAVQQRMIDVGWCRTYVNKQVVRGKGLFKWAVSRGLVPSQVFHGLQAVSGESLPSQLSHGLQPVSALRRGRPSARESKPVSPVPEPFIEAVKPFVSPQIRAMIELQVLTGMRPGEVCIMRSRDLETGGR